MNILIIINGITDLNNQKWSNNVFIAKQAI